MALWMQLYLIDDAEAYGIRSTLTDLAVGSAFDASSNPAEPWFRHDCLQRVLAFLREQHAATVVRLADVRREIDVRSLEICNARQVTP